MNYDFSKNTIVKDKILILGTNSQPQTNRAWLSGIGSPVTLPIGNNGDYYINTNAQTNNVYRKISNVWLQGNSFTTNLNSNHAWQIDGPVIEKDGYIEPKKIKVSF